MINCTFDVGFARVWCREKGKPSDTLVCENTNDTFDSDWRWLKAHQFAWTSLCHPSRVLNSSDRRIMASEATCDHDGFNEWWWQWRWWFGSKQRQCYCRKGGLILWRRWFVHHWRATASLSLNENDQLPLLDTFGHVARQSVDGLSWWGSWCRWLFMELIMVIVMILLLQTFRNVPSQSPGDFDEDCHQNDYYHDLLWCSWQCNDDMNENTVC